jgi:hypothetical protein
MKSLFVIDRAVFFCHMAAVTTKSISASTIPVVKNMFRKKTTDPIGTLFWQTL